MKLGIGNSGPAEPDGTPGDASGRKNGAVQCARTLPGKSVGALYREVVGLLEKHGGDSPAVEAGWLLAWVLGKRSHLDIWLDPEHRLTPRERDRLEDAVVRRIAGVPIQYITGGTSFFGIDLNVGPGVLIPRPETELLVESVLESGPHAGWLCDLCTGSGAVALALSRNSSTLSGVVGVDLSRRALAYAEENRRRAGLDDRVVWLAGDLLDPFRPGPRFSVITANPPYVSADEYERLPREVREYEPPEALLGGPDGLDLIRRIAASAPCYLAPGGLLACEIGADQGTVAAGIFRNAGFRDVSVRKDHAGHDRVVVARSARGGFS